MTTTVRRACGLQDDWKPGKELKERKPITEPDGLPLYPQP